MWIDFCVEWWGKKNLVSFFYTWISVFPLPLVKEALFSNACFWCLCQRFDGTCLFLGSLFYPISSCFWLGLKWCCFCWYDSVASSDIWILPALLSLCLAILWLFVFHINLRIFSWFCGKHNSSFDGECIESIDCFQKLHPFSCKWHILFLIVWKFLLYRYMPHFVYFFLCYWTPRLVHNSDFKYYCKKKSSICKYLWVLIFLVRLIPVCLLVFLSSFEMRLLF